MTEPRYETIAAIGGIVIVEVVALLLGHNGYILTGVVGALAGLGGFRYAQHRAKRG